LTSASLRNSAGARFGNPPSLMMPGLLALDRLPFEALVLFRLDAAGP
jgi:hypothetical protein